jgi:hypothetical protein
VTSPSGLFHDFDSDAIRGCPPPNQMLDGPGGSAGDAAPDQNPVELLLVHQRRMSGAVPVLEPARGNRDSKLDPVPHRLGW